MRRALVVITVFVVRLLGLFFTTNIALADDLPPDKVPAPGYQNCKAGVRQIAYSRPTGRQMGFVADIGEWQDGAIYPPEQELLLGFTLCNSGVRPWGETKLVILDGMGFTLRQGGTRGIVITPEVDIPSLPPGKQGDVWVTVRTPKDIGWYRFTFGVADAQTGERWGDSLWKHFYIGKKISDVYPFNVLVPMLTSFRFPSQN